MWTHIQPIWNKLPIYKNNNISGPRISKLQENCGQQRPIGHRLMICSILLVSLETPNRIDIQYIPRNMHTVFALLCFVVVIHWLIFPYPSGLLHWHCGNLTIAPMPAKQPWWIWINTSCEFIMNDCVTTTKQSTTKPCAYFLGYTVQCKHQHFVHRFLNLFDNKWVLWE